MARQPYSHSFLTPNYQPQENDIYFPVPAIGLDGMDQTSMLNEMAPGLCRLVRNFAIREGSYEVREGNSLIGTTASADLLAVHDIPLTDGTRKLVRWHEAGVDIWDGATWNAAGGDAWTGEDAIGVYFAITGWGDTVIFVCGDGQKLFELNLTTNNLTELTDSPTDVIHLTTFGNRVIATTREGIYWTVKNDSTDWTGLGSGFEDLKSAPGGVSDVATAVIPITDELAGFVRSNSVWQMAVTGDFDVPFNFSKLPYIAGSFYPQSCVQAGSSIICVGDDGAVWQMDMQQAVDVGQRIRSIIREAQEANIFHPGVGVWHPRWSEYLLIVTADLTQRVLRYRPAGGQWTEDVFQFPIRNISYSTFADLPTDDGVYQPGLLYAMGDNWRYIVRDDPDRSNDALREVDNTGTDVAGTFRIETGHLRKTDDMLMKTLYELILWYRAEGDVTLKLQYSDDDGANWNQIYDIPLDTTDKVLQKSLIFDPFQRDYIQIAISCNATSKLKINKLLAWLTEGGRSVDAN